MSAGSNVELTLFIRRYHDIMVSVSIQSGATESGQVVVFDTNNTEVSRSTTITVSTGSSYSVSMGGLTPGTRYIIKFYSDTIGDYSSSVINTSTLGYNKIYGSVSGNSTFITNMYGSVQTAVTTVSGDIRSGGEGNITAFDVNTFLSKMESDGRYTDSIEYVKVIPSNQDHGKYLISIYYVDEAHPTVLITPPVIYANMSNYGMTAKPPETATYGHDYIDFTYTTTTQSVSKQITKLYGSVNNQTKLVYQA